jgi:hypothetical protein
VIAAENQKKGLLQNALSFRAKREIRFYFTLFHVKSTDFSVASSLEMTGSCILQQAQRKDYEAAVPNDTVR